MGDNHVLCDQDEKNVETPHTIPMNQFEGKLIEVNLIKHNTIIACYWESACCFPHRKRFQIKIFCF
jgi:hypothetical protein